MIPVARNVWLPIGAMMPAAAARRRIMRQASAWFIGCSVNTVAVCLGLVRNSQPLRSSAMPSGGDVGVQRFGKRVMAWHLVLLAAFFVQPHASSSPLRPKILGRYHTGDLRSGADLLRCQIGERIENRHTP